MLLDDAGERTIKDVAAAGGRSVSATSRLLDHLLRRGLLTRREDERDRRAKRIAITTDGRALIAALESRRTEAQLALMAHLSDAEQAEVMRAMALLADAARRSDQHDQPDD